MTRYEFQKAAVKIIKEESPETTMLCTIAGRIYDEILFPFLDRLRSDIEELREI